MKLKAACIGTPSEVPIALSSTAFASEALVKVGEEQLGVHDILNRPAEYYVQKADVGPAPKEGVMGVEVRLTGVSREGRQAKQFHKALIVLSHIVEKTIQPLIGVGDKCQIFCVIMVDGDVETKPGSGRYSSNLESLAVHIDGTRES